MGAYAYEGNHEVIMWGNKTFYGALPDTAAAGWSYASPRAGQALIAHSNYMDGTHNVALGIFALNTIENHQYGATNFGENAGALVYYLTASNNRANAIAACRSWRFGNWNKGGVGTFPDLGINYEVDMYSRFSFTVAPAYTNTSSLMAYAAVQKHAVYIGPQFLGNFSGVTASGVVLRMIAEANQLEVDFVHAAFLNTNKATNYLTFDNNDSSSDKVNDVRWINSVWSTDVALGAANAVFTLNGAPTGSTAVADASIVGGMINCAFFNPGVTLAAGNFGAPVDGGAPGSFWGVNAGTGYVALAGAYVNSPPTAGALFRTGATTHAYSGIQWWVDHDTLDSNGFPVVRAFPTATPSIGSLQEIAQSPIVPANVGGGTTGLVLELIGLNK